MVGRAFVESQDDTLAGKLGSEDAGKVHGADVLSDPS